MFAPGDELGEEDFGFNQNGGNELDGPILEEIFEIVDKSEADDS